jgi:hypothetical protein
VFPVVLWLALAVGMGFFFGLGMAIFFGVSLKVVIGAAAFGVFMGTFLVWRVAEKAQTRSSK